MDSWSLRASRPAALVRPAPVDPAGFNGPTRGQAAGPHWRRTSPGLYVPAWVDRGVVEQRILEESCRLPEGGAVTGWAALRLHGVGYLDGPASDGTTEVPVPLVVPPGSNLRRTLGIKVHRERLDASEIAVRHGIPTACAARATFDAARRADGLRLAVVAIDMARSAGLARLADLNAQLARSAGWQGAKQVRKAIKLSDDRSMSPKETLLRLIWVLDANLPRPRCNWPVADAAGRFIGRPDLLSTELGVVGEFDGAEHRSRSRHRDDLRRDDLFRSVGLEPFRVVGADLEDLPLVRARIEAAIERARQAGAPRTWQVQANPRPVA